MEKYLWEIKLDQHNNLCKNKYTIIYENKTYVYCKVNGTDELSKFPKSKINAESRYSYLLTTEEEKVNKENLERQKKINDIRNLKHDISYAESCILTASQNIKKYEHDIVANKIRLAELESNLYGSLEKK